MHSQTILGKQCLVTRHGVRTSALTCIKLSCRKSSLVGSTANDTASITGGLASVVYATVSVSTLEPLT